MRLMHLWMCGVKLTDRLPSAELIERQARWEILFAVLQGNKLQRCRYVYMTTMSE